MATSALSPNFNPQFFDIVSGVTVPAAGYSLFTYLSGTTTPAATYTDQAGTSANANPIILDSAGRCTLWLTDGIEYTFVLQTPGGATIKTWDDVGGIPLPDATLYLPLAGAATMTGLFTLSGNATAALNPTPLQQVNTLIAAASASQTIISNSALTATTSSGTSTAYTLTPASALASLTTGAVRNVIFHVASGATPTMAVSGTAATAMKQYENGVKVDAKIAAGQTSNIVYDGTHWVIQAPQYGAIGTIAAAGSVTFGGGLIVKWGTTGTLGQDTPNNIITFPVPFPNACFVVFGQPSSDLGVDAVSSTYYSVGVSNYTTTQFKINNDAAAGTVAWLAIGN